MKKVIIFVLLLIIVIVGIIGGIIFEKEKNKDKNNLDKNNIVEIDAENDNKNSNNNNYIGKYKNENGKVVTIHSNTKGEKYYESDIDRIKIDENNKNDYGAIIIFDDLTASFTVELYPKGVNTNISDKYLKKGNIDNNKDRIIIYDTTGNNATEISEGVYYKVD